MMPPVTACKDVRCRQVASRMRAPSSEHQREFRLRNMKSLRQIFRFACVLLLAFLPVAIEAQSTPQQETPRVPPPLPARPPQSDAQAKIIRNVNYVVLPVTVKDRD